MGDVEILLNEEGALKVVQHHTLRGLLRRLQPKGSERHRVVRWRNCGGSLQSSPEESFHLFLKALFLMLLCVTVARILFHLFPPRWLFGPADMDWTGLLRLAVLTSIIVVGVFVKLCWGYSTPPRREEVKTISGLIQQV